MLILYIDTPLMGIHSYGTLHNVRKINLFCERSLITHGTPVWKYSEPLFISAQNTMIYRQLSVEQFKINYHHIPWIPQSKIQIDRIYESVKFSIYEIIKYHPS
jgi:hypothetical protein